MKIIKLLTLLLFIIVQNKCIFPRKGPFSDIVAPFREITTYIDQGIYRSSSEVNLRNYEYYQITSLMHLTDFESKNK